MRHQLVSPAAATRLAVGATTSGVATEPGTVSSTTHRVLLASALLAVFCAPTTGAQSPADTILRNARIYTVDEAKPWAQALAISGNQITAVGDNAAVEAHRGPATRVIDLDGAFVTPGFNDGHVHMDSTGMLLTGVNLLDVHEATAFAERVRAATTRLPRGSWIVRGDWGAYERWEQSSSGRDPGNPEPGSSGPFTPNRDLIDSFTGEYPVLLSRFDRSMYLANSLALTRAGITEAVENPVGGEFDRDASGRLTGILRGSAVDLVQSVIPPMPFDQRLVGVRAVLREAREGGVTTIQDLTSPEQLMAYQRLLADGELTARIMIRPNVFQVEHVAALGISGGFGSNYLKVVGYKGWVDGIMGNSSAMFFRAYDHDPQNRGALRRPMLPESVEGGAFSLGESDHYSQFPPGRMEQYIDAWVATGVPAHIHAIGDLGNRILLDIYTRVLEQHNLVGSDHRWRVIHAQVVREEDFARFGELNLIAEVNPYHVSDDMRWMEERIGASRSEGAYAFRKLKDAGAVLVFGSDSPGTNAARYFLSPVYGLYAAVSRQTLSGDPAGGWFPDQRLTIEEAIDAYTRAPAWACFEEDIKGTLTPGKLADIAVFDTNLVTAGHDNPASLLDARVLYTIVGGEIVYQR